jgi:O-antigen ligase
VAASLALGAAVAAQPFVALGLAMAAVALTLGLRYPEAIAGAGLLLLAFGPSVTIGHPLGGIDPEPIRKTLLILCFAPAALRYGFNHRLLAPLAAYAVLGVITITLSDRPNVLTSGQIADSYVTLTLAWAILAIRWPPHSARLFLRVLALLASVSVVAGAMLHAVGIGDFVTGASVGGGTDRLGGATFPSELAFLAVIGISASLISIRMFGGSSGAWLAAVNGAILAATVTRGSMAAGLILLLPPAIRFLKAARPGVGVRPELRFLLVAVILVAAVVAVAPAVLARNSSGSDPGSLNTSGRTGAWNFFWRQAQQSPLVGRGLGSGPVIDVNKFIIGGGFKAQHNEYLRLFLEGGYLGFAIVLAAILLTLARVARYFPARARADLWALLFAFALLSFVDNTLSAPEFAISFGVLLAVMRACGRAGVQARTRAPQAGSTSAVPV